MAATERDGRRVGGKHGREKEVFPPPLEHTYPQVICMPHPAQAHCVTLEDDVLCGLRILDILVDLHKVRLREEVQWREEGVEDMHHSNAESNV